MISINDKSLCCGCEGCTQVCPTKCISMVEDEEGFSYPAVNQKDCIECGLCIKVCPILESPTLKNESNTRTLAFASQHKEDGIRADSSSGGAFSLFANRILMNGGLVFGSTLDENLRAVHIGIENKNDLERLRGSKYIQSKIGEVYSEIHEALKNGREVLFVGTPCQAAGLYTFLRKKKYDNLYIVDFACHGVPSPKIFESYIKSEEQKKGSKVTGFKFRNKDHGWSQTGLQLGTKLEFEDGTELRKYPAFMDTFMNGFLDDIYLMPACYDCKFKFVPKEFSDFTIADFWGVNKIAPEMNDKKGTSLILINTEKGKRFWNDIKDDSLFQEVDLNKAINSNKPLIKTTKMNPKRSQFFKDYSEKGFLYVERKYMSAFTWGMHKVTNILGTKLKKIEQLIKFAIVGTSNTIINLLIYYSCLAIGVHYTLAYTLGFLISVCNAFYWNNKYVFMNKKEKSIVKAFIKVVLSYGFTFILSLGMMGVFIDVLGISSYIAPILKLIITIPLNFILNKIWAFKDKKIVE